MSNSNQSDNYRILIKKLIQLVLNNWPKFQEQQKNLYSAEIHQTEAKTKLKKNYNKQKSNETLKIIQEKNTQNLLLKYKPLLQKNTKSLLKVSPTKQKPSKTN